MSSLVEKSQTILDEKTLKIIPENIKKDITVLGVTGTYNGPDTGIKLFETLEEMNSDTNAKEGDLAVVYRNEITNMTSDSVVSSVTFPETVTLQSAFTDNVYCRLRSMDSSIMFDGTVMINSNSFRFDGFADNGMIRVEYSSADGITYNRTSFTGDSGDLTNPVDLGTNVIVENADEWSDIIGQFILVGGNIFEGLYEYKLNVQTDDFNFPNLETATLNVGDDGDFIYNDILPNVYSLNKLNSISFETEYGIVFIDTNNNLKLLCSDIGLDRILVNADKSVIGLCSINTTGNVAKLYTVNYETLELSNEQNLDLLTYGSSNHLYVAITDIKSAPIRLNSSTRYYSQLSTGIIGDTITNWNWSQKMDLFNYKDQYICMTTQLNAGKENVYNSTFYGKNGVETGTLGVDIDTTYFVDTNAKLYSTLQVIYCNTPLKHNGNDLCFIPQDINGNALMDFSGKDNLDMYFSDRTILKCVPKLNIPDTVTSMRSMFSNTYNLEYIADITLPSNMTNLHSFLWMANGNEKLKTAPKINTENVTDFWGMYSRCKALVNVPVYNLASATDLSSMFSGCENLSDDSLNNIMSSLISAVAYTGTKTLKKLGITEAQATRCQALSNYQSFTEAGWTTGY